MSIEPEDPGRPVQAVKTLVITDIVGSTDLVEQMGDHAASELFMAVDRLARDLLQHHDGLEIDRTDGFLLMFDRPLSAVAYAAELHAGLAKLSSTHPVEMRVGIHIGDVVLRTNAPKDVARGAKPLEVEGLAKPYTARLMSMARGGQTLLSRNAFELARRAAIGKQDLPPLNWADHGTWQLKGVSDPVAVFEVSVGPPRTPEGGAKAHPIGQRSRALPLSGLGAIVAAALLAAGLWWLQAPGSPEYTTLDRLHQVSDDPETQRHFEAAFDALLRDEATRSRQEIALVRKAHPDNAQALLIATMADIRRGEPDVDALEDALSNEFAGRQGADEDLLRWLAAAKIDGAGHLELMDSLQAHLEANPDHLYALMLCSSMTVEHHITVSNPCHVTLMESELAPVIAFQHGAYWARFHHDFETAREILERGLERYSSSQSLSLTLADVSVDLGDLEGARAALATVVAARPGDAAPRVRLAVLDFAAGDDQAARAQLDILDGATFSVQDRIESLVTVATRIVAEQGRLGVGRELFDRAAALSRDHDDDELELELAIAHVKMHIDIDLVDAETLEGLARKLEVRLANVDLAGAQRARIEFTVLEARAHLALARGDVEAALELGDRAGSISTSDARWRVHAVQDPESLRASGPNALTCRGRLWRGNSRFDAQIREYADSELRFVDDEVCHTYRFPSLVAKAHAHLATLALEAGDLSAARRHLQAFRERWPHVDPTTPIAREANRVAAELGEGL